MHEYLALRDVQKILKVSRASLYTWRNEGKIKFYKIGKLTRIRKEDVENLVQEEKRREK